MTDEENKQLTQEVWMVHNVYGRGYIDAIEEFLNECVKFEDITFNREHIQRIKMIAEELKEKNNDTSNYNAKSDVINVKKKCPKGNDTNWTCYEVCEHRENGICTLNN